MANNCTLMVFQHTAARRRLRQNGYGYPARPEFQHTAARRRLTVEPPQIQPTLFQVSTHSRPKAAGWPIARALPRHLVSTHSRPKAAGAAHVAGAADFWFQHTAARRRLETAAGRHTATDMVSTHSRPKAAGRTQQAAGGSGVVSTHSRPKAAGGE